MARPVEDQGFDNLETLSVNAEFQEFEVCHNAKREKTSKVHKKRAPTCLGDVPNIAVPSMLGEKQKRNSDEM